ncbi:3'-5' exonuclease [Oceanirhabdus seepicola]|uniref:Exonuclease domain-containing protein n=1 Tax=Oceanirhabdus seepicola TaxID=2828781 RepID=A0A9J6NUQ6_9CLOT|nr:3'-5' exonuclease [Oceanirhabdus seepicola]MCM1988215.1 exonuclease domain-containing protein [Oceanirhabdus seepicola]
MNYIIFDLEFNQAFNPKKRVRAVPNESCPFEIIQIGAVKLNKNFETISKLDRFIKPEIYKDIHPFVRRMTGIRIEQLNNAKSFKDVFKEFVDFIGDDIPILCIWGMGDMKELFRNVEYHSLNKSLVPKKYINIQFFASNYFNCPKGCNIGLKNAVEMLHIPHTNEFHNAYNDAYFTAEIFKVIHTKKIEPKEYNIAKYLKKKRENNIKEIIDYSKLYLQFAKMFERELTKEDKSMIKMAYIMGKTHQFVIDGTESKEDQIKK